MIARCLEQECLTDLYPISKLRACEKGRCYPPLPALDNRLTEPRQGLAGKPDRTWKTNKVCDRDRQRESVVWSHLNIFTLSLAQWDYGEQTGLWRFIGWGGWPLQTALATGCCCGYAVIRSYNGNNGLMVQSKYYSSKYWPHINLNSEFSTKDLYLFCPGRRNLY